MKRSTETLGTGLFVLLLSGVMVYLTSTQIQDASLAGVSPRAIPYMVALCVLFVSLVMIGRGLVQYLLRNRKGVTSRPAITFQRFPFQLFLLILLYVVAMGIAGYFIASFTVLPLIMAVLGLRKPTSYAVLACLVIVVFVVIDGFLRIGLPKIGLWGII